MILKLCHIQKKRWSVIGDKRSIFEQEVKCCEKNDLCYPKELKKIKDSPPILYYKGDIGILNQQKNIAVIGSRKISENGIRLAYNAGKIIGKNGFNWSCTWL